MNKYKISLKVEDGDDGFTFTHHYGLREGITEKEAIAYAKTKKAICPGDKMTVTLTKTTTVYEKVSRKRR